MVQGVVAKESRGEPSLPPLISHLKLNPIVHCLNLNSEEWEEIIEND